ncbi:MAG: hypothetical protein VB089_20355 [Anaerolineaceae bacterium]|nr:hypothetical protein [Anaerolineaceae bacterium]
MQPRPSIDIRTILRERANLVAMLLLLVVFFAVRLSLWVHPPQTYADSSSYYQPANQIVASGFSLETWDSDRVPVYPLFLAAVFSASGGENLPAVITIQKLLGLAIALVLFWMGRRLSGSPWIGLAFGLFYALNVPAALFEVTILTETFSLCLVVVAVALQLWILSLLQRREAPEVGLLVLYLALGVLCAGLALTRHAFAAYWLAPLSILALAILLQPAPQRQRRRRLVMAAFLAVLPIIAVLAWSDNNRQRFGWFTFSPIAGSNLSNMAGGFMEAAESEDCQSFVALYLKYRAMEMAENQTHAMTINRAREEWIDVQNVQQRVDFQKLAYQCSLEAILARPDLYVQTMLESRQLFWDPAFYSRNPLVGITGWLADRSAAVLRLLKVLFEAASLLWVLYPAIYALARREPFTRQEILSPWLAAGLVLATTWYVYLTSIGFEYGENRRYKSVVEPLIPAAITLVGLLYTRLFTRPRAPRA